MNHLLFRIAEHMLCTGRTHTEHMTHTTPAPAQHSRGLQPRCLRLGSKAATQAPPGPPWRVTITTVAIEDAIADITDEDDPWEYVTAPLNDDGAYVDGMPVYEVEDHLRTYPDELLWNNLGELTDCSEHDAIRLARLWRSRRQQ